MNKKLFFSIISGEIIEVPDDEVKNLEEHHVPLLSRPKRTCKHCYGRGYFAFEPERQYYLICRCMSKKHIDHNALGKDNIIVENPITINNV